MKKLSLLLALLFLISCGQLPAPRTAQKIVTHHFKKYGKKYKETDFGHFRVDKVEINDIQLIQKKLAEIDAVVTLGEGASIYRVRVLTEKKAFGWRIIGWESLKSL